MKPGLNFAFVRSDSYLACHGTLAFLPRSLAGSFSHGDSVEFRTRVTKDGRLHIGQAWPAPASLIAGTACPAVDVKDLVRLGVDEKVPFSSNAPAEAALENVMDVVLVNDSEMSVLATTASERSALPRVNLLSGLRRCPGRGERLPRLTVTSRASPLGRKVLLDAVLAFTKAPKSRLLWHGPVPPARASNHDLRAFADLHGLLQ